MTKSRCRPRNCLSKLTLLFLFPNNSHQSLLSTSEMKKRPNSLTLTTSSPTKARLTSEYDNTPQTPNQPTIAKIPAFSEDSIEFTEEDKTKRMIGMLIDTVLYDLGKQFRDIPWPSHAKRSRFICSGSLLSNPILACRHERSGFVLGRKPIIAINDSSVIIEFSRSPYHWGINDYSRKISDIN
jgi:hypothetical protein